MEVTSWSPTHRPPKKSAPLWIGSTQQALHTYRPQVAELTQVLQRHVIHHDQICSDMSWIFGIVPADFSDFPWWKNVQTSIDQGTCYENNLLIIVNY